MKKIYILLLSNLLLQYTWSQPTISFLPKIGDVVSYENTHTTSVLPGTLGANITWDYSTLVDSADAGTFTYEAPAGTPYVSDFPGAQLASNLDDTLFTYFKIVSGDLAEMGLESKNLKESYVRPLAIMQNPFTYLNEFTDSITVLLEKPLPGNSKLFDTILVSGYGTLKLPNMTYSNVLQVRHINATSGTLFLPGGIVIPIPLNTDTSYSYYVSGMPGPILFYNLYKGSINEIDYLKNSIVLSLHFISFTATLQHGIVQLQWQTSDESNTKVFHIQRSTGGSDFTNIGEVNANGSGNHEYYFSDAVPAEPQTLYYRLQETDIDGNSFYSNIAVCNMPGTANASLYPNPANNFITINGVDNFSVLKIYNLSGQLLKYYSINGESKSITVPVTSLLPGVYIAELSNGSKATRIRFLKQ